MTPHDFLLNLALAPGVAGLGGTLFQRAPPAWLPNDGPQPATGTLWRSWHLDPRLNGRFQSLEYPDDHPLLVVGEVNQKATMDLFWVSVRACEADTSCSKTPFSSPARTRARPCASPSTSRPTRC